MALDMALSPSPARRDGDLSLPNARQKVLDKENIVDVQFVETFYRVPHSANILPNVFKALSSG